MRHGDVLVDIQRCPHCNVTKPLMQKLWLQNVSRNELSWITWAAYCCASCRQLILAASTVSSANTLNDNVIAIFPAGDRELSPDIPERARRYLQQAIQAKAMHDGCAMLVASAVDAMLKAKGLKDGSLFDRIDNAVTTGLLTPEMASWAHEIRLASNAPRHADLDDPHVTDDEAANLLEFASVLAQFLFELPAKVQRGRLSQRSKGETG